MERKGPAAAASDHSKHCLVGRLLLSFRKETLLASRTRTRTQSADLSLALTNPCLPPTSQPWQYMDLLPRLRQGVYACVSVCLYACMLVSWCVPCLFPRVGYL